jgi:hypothetical protein
MFLIGAVAIGILIGFAMGGRINHLPELRLRFLWLVAIAIIIQLAIFPLFSSRPLVPYLTSQLHLASYGILFVFFIINYRVWPMLIIAIGSICNLVVISLNQGRMPSSVHALARAGQPEIAAKVATNGFMGNVVLMSENTKLNELGDWLYLPGCMPFSTAFSIGDLLIAVGLVVLIIYGMRSHE